MNRDRSRPGAASAGEAHAPVRAVVAPVSARLLQRQCACGGGGGGAAGECEECRKRKLVQRRADVSADVSPAVPSSVHAVIGSSGRPLDPAERSFFEPRFGHDFSRVRIHDDSIAAESASAVSALAYTVGDHIAFGAGQFRPGTAAGRELLAHELVHTLQQRDVGSGPPVAVDATSSPWEREADVVARAALGGDAPGRVRVGGGAGGRIQRTPVPHCTTGTHGAPADTQRTLEAIETFANTWAILASVAASSDATHIRLHRSLNPGQPALPTNASFAAFQNRFGLAPASGTKFRNRVSGARFDSQEEAVASELDTLSARLMRMSDQMDGNIHFFCIGGGATRMDCEGHCTGRLATACPGIRAVLLCPGFWGIGVQQQATLLLHELGHMIWSSVRHGSNFTHTSCYANYVADVFSAPTTTPACVP